MPPKRDPVSEMFDGPARRLLERAYARPGTWVATRLADPGLRARTYAAGFGIGDLTGPDRPSAIGGRRGGIDARSRWARGFVRAIYYQHKNFSRAGRAQSWQRRASPRETGALRVEVGRHVPASPQFNPADPSAGGFPAGRRVRVMLATGGRAALAAVAELGDRDRIYTEAGGPGRRWSDPSRRDW